MKIAILITCLIFTSCASNDDEVTMDMNSLLSYLGNKPHETGEVIACSGNSAENPNEVEIYFFPEQGSGNFKIFQTLSKDVDPNNFSNYVVLDLENEPFFNGTLRKFVSSITSERWVVVTFELDEEIKISNPIRLKQFEQPTLFSNQITINQDISQMPVFNWDINSEILNAIFFQVVSNSNNDLISGTYTFENQFQYYNLSNVVLNITSGTPQDLIVNEVYNFTVMDVSADNWVNQILKIEFIAE